MNFLDELKKMVEDGLERYQDSLDFHALNEVKNKPIEKLTESDFESLNMMLHGYYGYKELYRCKDFSGDDIFLNRLEDRTFELLDREKKKITDIKTTTELIDKVLTKFQLKKFDQSDYDLWVKPR